MTKTSEDLRDFLFSTLYDVKAGRCDLGTAHAVAKLSEAIVKTAALEIEYYKHVTKEGGGHGYAPQTRIALTRRNGVAELEPEAPESPARDRIAAIAKRPV